MLHLNKFFDLYAKIPSSIFAIVFMLIKVLEAPPGC